MKHIAIVASLVLPIILAGCFSSTERVERRVTPETTTTITQTPAPYYSAPDTVTTTTRRDTAPGTVTTTTRRDTVIENRY